MNKMARNLESLASKVSTKKNAIKDKPDNFINLDEFEITVN